jgi:hypothetical protein
MYEHNINFMFHFLAQSPLNFLNFINKINNLSNSVHSVHIPTHTIFKVKTVFKESIQSRDKYRSMQLIF